MKVTGQEVAVGAMADCLLPGDPVWPSASDLGLAPAILEAADRQRDWAAAMKTIIAALPVRFAAGGADSRSRVLKQIETDQPDQFKALVTLAYCVYYSDDRVLRIIESIFGFPARPPQPLGHSLPPFDPAILRDIRKKKPVWRKVRKRELS